MKKGDLAAAAAERMGGRGWLPPALVIAEPEPEAEDEPAPVADGDGDDEEFEEAKAAGCAGRAGRKARLRFPDSSSRLTHMLVGQQAARPRQPGTGGDTVARRVE